MNLRYSSSGYFFSDDNDEYDNCIPMRFLGYKDKKGNDVYEDFILKVSRYNRLNEKHFTEYILAPNKVNSGDIITNLIGFEIVGNIHQNLDEYEILNNSQEMRFRPKK